MKNSILVLGIVFCIIGCKQANQQQAHVSQDTEQSSLKQNSQQEANPQKKDQQKANLKQKGLQNNRHSAKKETPLFRMQKNFKWGFMDSKGNWKIEPVYLWATRFHNGAAAVASNQNTYRVIDKNGDFLFEKEFNQNTWVPNEIGENIPQQVMDSFSQGFAAINKYKKHYFINKKGEQVFGDDFREVSSFSDGLAQVTKDKMNYGFINTSGKIVIPLEFNEVGDFFEGLAAVQVFNESQEQWGYIDKKGDWAIKPQNYSKVGPFSEGLAFARSSQNRRYGFINKKGETVVKYQFKAAKSFSNGLALIKSKYKWGFRSKDAKDIPAKYEKAHSFSEGLAAVKKDGNWFYIDTDGKVAIKNEILNHASRPYPFHNGLALIAVSFDKESGGVSSGGLGEYRVMDNSWYALMDKQGNFIYKQPKNEREMMKTKIDSIQKAQQR